MKRILNVISDLILYIEKVKINIVYNSSVTHTYIFNACLIGNLNLVKYLVENRADINKRDNNSWTSLHIACQNGDIEVVKYLV